MGVYANLHKAEGSYIPEDKQKEFEERLEKVFQASGMMDSEYVFLFGIKIMLMHKAKMHYHGMDFTYNYFDDDFWENAGYSLKNNRVGSGKIGGRSFSLGVLTAYALEGLYSEGVSFISFNGEWVYEDVLIGWINYLFDEKFAVKNRNIWKMNEIAHYENKYGLEEQGIECFFDIMKYNDATLSWLEQVAVYKGIDIVKPGYSIHENKDADPYLTLYADLFRNMIDELQRRKENGTDESDIDEVLELLEIFYGSNISEDDFLRMCTEKGFESFGIFTSKFDLPALAIKIEAENYNKDFWALWDRVRKTINSSKRTFPEPDDAPKPETPNSTEEMFKLSYDDMIPYWTEGGKILFSDELENWFIEIKKRYDIMVESDISVEGNNDRLKWIIGMLNYANSKYYRIYAFADFFYETLDNLDDRRYLALWKLFEDMLHDPELQEAGSVIFLKNNEERNIIINYREGDSGARRLNETWQIMRPEKKFNKARMTFRRYMALVANKELRNKVFGF